MIITHVNYIIECVRKLLILIGNNNIDIISMSGHEYTIDLQNFVGGVILDMKYFTRQICK